MKEKGWGIPRLISNSSISKEYIRLQSPPQRPVRKSVQLPCFKQAKRRVSSTSRHRAPSAVHSKVIYVLKDGSRVDETLPFFRYVVWEGGSVVGILRASEENLKPGRPFTHVFAYDGTVVTSISDLKDCLRIILVSSSRLFVGLDWQSVPKLTENMLFDQLSARNGFRLHPIPGLTSSPRFPRAPSLRPSVSPVRVGVATPRLKPPVVQVDEVMRPLSNSQIAVLCEQYGLTIAKVHELYARYKTLLAMHVYYKPGCTLEEGIDKDTFVHYLRGALIYGKELLQRLFDTVSGSGYMTWPQFAKAMASLSVGSRKDKISLIFKLSAGNSSFLTYDKVKELCLMALGHAKRDAVVEEIADYFAQTVFMKAGIGKNEVVAAERLEEVLERDKNDGFLQLFCFNDAD